MNLSWLLPTGKGIPVLLYHKVWREVSDDLTITPERLEEHFRWLKDNGYKTLTLQQYLQISRGEAPDTGRNVLITFDDGYRNNHSYAYPLLQQMGLCATFFIIGDTLAGARSRDVGPEKKMTVAEMATLDPAVVQLALHGYHHLHMGKVGWLQMSSEITNAVDAFKQSGLPFNRVLAYPYGGRPASKGDFDKLRQLMEGQGIEAAFRIGNAVSTVPAADKYQIKRIDIKGTDTVKMLRTKLKKGKLHLF